MPLLRHLHARARYHHLYLKVVATTYGGGLVGLSFLLFFWFFSFSFFFLQGVSLNRQI